MAQYRKILLSGSNAHVAQVTASNVPAATDNNTVLFVDSTGRVRTLSNLTFDSSQTTLVFDGGTFSGSFSGDGSGLTGVTAELGNNLVDGAGVVDFSFDGSTGITASLDLHTKGGLAFYDGNTDSGTSTGTGTDGFKLGLTSSLDGEGLTFPNSNDYSVLAIQLEGDSNGSSGLKLGAAGLSVSDNIAGDGLNYNTGTGVMSVDLATNSGLQIDGGELQLHDNLPGTGLEYATGNSVIQIDSSTVVDNGNTITFNTSSTNIVIDVTSDGSVTDVAQGKRALLIDNPVLSMNLSDTLEGNFTFNDNVTITGDLLVNGASSEVAFEVQNLNIADQFILVNSGSTNTDGGLAIHGPNANDAAFLFYDEDNNRWGVSNDTQTWTDNGHEIDEDNHAALVTVEITTSAPSTFLAGNPLFGINDNTRLGQLKITTTPGTNESSAFIFA
jgi:hypothetical protein